ncbi:hypothetical protein J6590_038265, partial [Homalodisca vitripennis]
VSVVEYLMYRPEGVKPVQKFLISSKISQGRRSVNCAVQVELPLNDQFGKSNKAVNELFRAAVTATLLAACSGQRDGLLIVLHKSSSPLTTGLESLIKQ